MGLVPDRSAGTNHQEAMNRTPGQTKYGGNLQRALTNWPNATAIRKQALQILFRSNDTERDPTCSIVVIWVKNLQSELMCEIDSKSLVRAIGRILLMKFS